MIARPKISRNEWKTAEIGAFEVGKFALFSCAAYDVRAGLVHVFTPRDPKGEVRLGVGAGVRDFARSWASGDAQCFKFPADLESEVRALFIAVPMSVPATGSGALRARFEERGGASLAARRRSRCASCLQALHSAEYMTRNAEHPCVRHFVAEVDMMTLVYL